MPPLTSKAPARKAKKASGSRFEKRVLFLGVDASGKTTALYQLKLGDVVTTIPTIGFNVETLDVPRSHHQFTIWDVGGQPKIQALWRHYLSGTELLVFFVDTSDPARWTEAGDALKNLTQEDDLAGVPILLVGSKMDVPGAETDTVKLMVGMGLDPSLLGATKAASGTARDPLSDRSWDIVLASCTNNLDEVLMRMVYLACGNTEYLRLTGHGHHFHASEKAAALHTVEETILGDTQTQIDKELQQARREQQIEDAKGTYVDGMLQNLTQFISCKIHGFSYHLGRKGCVVGKETTEVEQQSRIRSLVALLPEDSGVYMVGEEERNASCWQYSPSATRFGSEQSRFLPHEVITKVLTWLPMEDLLPLANFRRLNGVDTFARTWLVSKNFLYSSLITVFHRLVLWEDDALASCVDQLLQLVPGLLRLQVPVPLLSLQLSVGILFCHRNVYEETQLPILLKCRIGALVPGRALSTIYAGVCLLRLFCGEDAEDGQVLSSCDVESSLPLLLPSKDDSALLFTQIDLNGFVRQDAEAGVWLSTFKSLLRPLTFVDPTARHEEEENPEVGEAETSDVQSAFKELHLRGVPFGFGNTADTMVALIENNNYCRLVLDGKGKNKTHPACLIPDRVVSAALRAVMDPNSQCSSFEFIFPSGRSSISEDVRGMAEVCALAGEHVEEIVITGPSATVLPEQTVMMLEERFDKVVVDANGYSFSSKAESDNEE